MLNKPAAFSITPIGTLAQNLKWLLTLNGQVKVTKSLIASKWLLIRHRCLLERKSVRHFRISQKVIMNNDICSCCIKVTYHGILRPSLMHVCSECLFFASCIKSRSYCAAYTLFPDANMTQLIGYVCCLALLYVI